MILRKYRIYRRSNGVYYYIFFDPITGKEMKARSTGARNRSEAEKVAARAYRQFLDEQRMTVITAKMPVGRYVEWFYGEENSSWYAEKRERDENAFLSDHIRATRSYFARYLKRIIGDDIILAEVTPFWLRRVQRELRDKYPKLTPQTINAIFASLTKPLRYAATQWIIQRDPTENILAFAARRKITGCFEQFEVNSLLSLGWESLIGKLMFMVAIHTGMRMGEILALKKGDLQCRVNGTGELYLVAITHSWSKTHGLKSPKSGKTRTVPIPAWLWNQLWSFVGQEKNDDAFVFASSNSGKPVSDKLPRWALNRALQGIGITEEQQRERNLRFHSTRHYFNSMMAPHLQNEALRKVIGHSSPEMTDHYHHVTDIELRMVKDAQELAFPIIPFTARGATA
ncbi:site-specific integrase [Treponema zuelzerae]|uniref:Site-specific integrase n=1 Tax=Teretinema zuelzerae TaxID=156 RepID=A0AAE3JIQ6_9SPIR|nr:site-specific integrase [Teretinema zuelzerae]MCD1655497.1 site-specific integrase [Teretinema zuelzerae]